MVKEELEVKHMAAEFVAMLTELRLIGVKEVIVLRHGSTEVLMTIGFLGDSFYYKEELNSQHSEEKRKAWVQRLSIFVASVSTKRYQINIKY